MLQFQRTPYFYSSVLIPLPRSPNSQLGRGIFLTAHGIVFRVQRNLLLKDKFILKSVVNWPKLNHFTMHTTPVTQRFKLPIIKPDVSDSTPATFYLVLALLMYASNYTDVNHIMPEICSDPHFAGFCEIMFSNFKSSWLFDAFLFSRLWSCCKHCFQHGSAGTTPHSHTTCLSQKMLMLKTVALCLHASMLECACAPWALCNINAATWDAAPSSSRCPTCCLCLHPPVR